MSKRTLCAGGRERSPTAPTDWASYRGSDIGQSSNQFRCTWINVHLPTVWRVTFYTTGPRAHRRTGPGSRPSPAAAGGRARSRAGWSSSLRVSGPDLAPPSPRRPSTVQLHFDDRAVQKDPRRRGLSLDLVSLQLGEDAFQDDPHDPVITAHEDREPAPIALRSGAPFAALAGDEQPTVQRPARRQLAVAPRRRHQGSDPLPLRISQIHMLNWAPPFAHTHSLELTRLSVNTP